MKTFRFIDGNGTRHTGTNFLDGTAEIVEGGIVQKDAGRIQVHRFLPVIEPVAVFCIGLNYLAHARETGMKAPVRPIVFMKNPASVTGHNQSIVLPSSCREPLQVDYEVELGVVIGRSAKNVSVESALDYVAGYTVANDVSARKWQKEGGGGQWVRGKSFDTFCPVGPVFVSADEIEDPNDLALETVLNGQVLQQSRTSDMIFSVRELIAFLSEDTTLMPGTLILTGTPEGVGFTRTPPVFLKPGDRIEMTIEKIGTLVNNVE